MMGKPQFLGMMSMLMANQQESMIHIVASQAVMLAMLIDKGIIDREEYEKELVVSKADMDQFVMEQRQESFQRWREDYPEEAKMYDFFKGQDKFMAAMMGLMEPSDGDEPVAGG